MSINGSISFANRPIGKCKTCKKWTQSKQDRGTKRGKCHHMPPSYGPDDEDFLVTLKEEWCSMYQARR